jgi:hypothetical protein
MNEPGATERDESRRVRRRRRRKMPPRVEAPTWRFWHLALALGAAFIAIVFIILARGS